MAGPAIPTDDWYGTQFTFEDRREPSGQDAVLLLRHHVTPAYFKTIGTPILKGRSFTMADAGDAAMPVAILSKSAADRYLGNRDPVGRRIMVGARGASQEAWLTIVGVAGDIRHGGFGREDRPAPDIYLPMLEYPPASPPIFNLLVRSEGSAAGPLTKSLRAAVAEVAPDLPLYDVATMESRLDSQASRRRFLVLVVGLFGFFGLTLVIIGIYGVLSYAVAQSTREIAVRMAIGAEHGEVRRLVVKRALLLVFLGITLGLILTFGLTRRLQDLLYGVQATDLATLAAVSGLMTIVGFFASYLPARRATRIDPMRSLREN
jgi:putative ABC transport system permease protein